MQAGLMLPGSVRGDSRREGRRGREREEAEREQDGGRQHAGGQREYSDDNDVMLIMIRMTVIAAPSSE